MKLMRCAIWCFVCVCVVVTVLSVTVIVKIQLVSIVENYTHYATRKNAPDSINMQPSTQRKNVATQTISLDDQLHTDYSDNSHNRQKTIMTLPHTANEGQISSGQKQVLAEVKEELDYSEETRSDKDPEAKHSYTTDFQEQVLEVLVKRNATFHNTMVQLNGKNVTTMSQNPDITTRGKWQMKQVERFCKKYKMDNLSISLPKSGPSRHNLFRHLLFDDERKLLFCFIPKVGCKNMRRFMFVLQGLLPLESIYKERVPEAKLVQGYPIVSFTSKKLEDKQRLLKMKNYWKFVMIRNPLERLLSAYLDKLSKPLTSLNPQSEFEQQKLTILSRYKPSLVKECRTNKLNKNYTGNLQVDFETYLQWVVDTPNDKLNEHFTPMVAIAQPCRMRYNFYGNFKMYSSEMEQIVKKLKVPLEYYHNQPDHHMQFNNSTSIADLLRPFYSEVKLEVKRKLLHDFYQELEFYYSLYPEEKYSHFGLLGVREDVLE